MATINTAKIKEKAGLKHENPRLSWQDSPPVQRLLDVIASIIVSEYVQTTKLNPEVFLSGGKTR